MPAAAMNADSKTDEAQAWFTQVSEAFVSPGAIDWKQASTVDDYLIAPLTIRINPFADAHQFGYRFAVMQLLPGRTPKARIVELVADEQVATVEQASGLVLEGIKSVFDKGTPGPIAGFTGYFLVYTPTYFYQSGSVYQNGALQPSQVRLAAQTTSQPATSGNGSQGKLMAVTICATTTVCGTVTVSTSGNPTQNCASSTNCGSGLVAMDDWENSGGSGGSGSNWGGSATPGGGGSPDFPTGISTVDADIQQATPTLGNHAATLFYKKNTWQIINVTVELDTNAHDLKKVTVTLNGITWLSQLTQAGDGVLTGYNASTDTYSFQVSIQNTYGGVWSSQTTIYGTYSPSQGHGTLSIP